MGRYEEGKRYQGRGGRKGSEDMIRKMKSRIRRIKILSSRMICRSIVTATLRHYAYHILPVDIILADSFVCRIVAMAISRALSSLFTL